MKKLMRVAVSALSVLVLTACGAGSSSTVSQTPTGFSVEGGLAQKGPLLKGSRVSIAELNPLNYAPAGPSYDLLTTDNMGGFSSSGINFTRQHIQTFAQGYYFNEITGALASDSVLLQAQGDLTSDRLVNVNLLTTLAGPRIVALVTDKTNAYGLSTYRNFAKSRTQAQKEVLAAFRIYNGADMMSGDTSPTTITVPNNFNELDIAKAATPNKVLLALSALAMQIGGNGVGVSQFIANFQLDLKDDGLINGTAGSSALQTQISAASKTVNMATVASNLTSFYASDVNYKALLSTSTFTAGQLTPWVDSSGGLDLVVDGFKATSTSASTTAVNKSSIAYLTGSEDDGQCFSVGTLTNLATNATDAASGVTGSLYVGDTANTAALVSITSTPVARGKSVVLGLTPTAAGTYSGFLQRSPAVSGSCANTTSAATRVFKYTITTTGSTAPSLSGVPTGVIVTAGSGQATVTFTAPTSTGGSAIKAYTATCQIGTNSSTAKTASGISSPIVVTGLTNGNSYTCTVKANNGVGESASSSALTVMPTASSTSTFSLTSVAGLSSGALPAAYTCDGTSVSPALAWTNAPSGTTKFAVVMSTIPGPGSVKYNWLLYNIPAGTAAVVQGATAGGTFGYSDDGGGLAYAPPCSSGAGTKDYTFTVYALSASPTLPSSASAVTGSVLTSAISGITLGSASVTLSSTRTQATINCKQIQKSLGSYATSNGLSIACGYGSDTANAYFNTPGIQTANPMMTGITQTILQVPTAQTFTGANAWKIPMVPAIAATTTTAEDGPIGVAVNGIPIFNACKQGGCQYGDTKALGELDTCNGHAGKADDYHYHAAPVCMMAEKTKTDAHFWDTNPIGWALDGFAIFGYYNPDGTTATRDSVCGGNTLTHSNAPTGYAYHVTDSAPYVLSCFKGTPVEDVARQAGDKYAVLHDGGANLGNAGGSPVSGMVLDTNADKLAIGGTSTLSWTKNSTSYQILYKRTTSLCWNFIFKTSGTVTTTQDYCRAF